MRAMLPLLLVMSATLASCARAENAPSRKPAAAADPSLARAIAAMDASSADAASSALFPEAERTALRARVEAAPGRFLELVARVEAARAADPFLLRRVGKGPGGALGETYVPSDLVALDGKGLSVSRPGHQLRRPAYDALREMDAAARAEGITLLVSSSYRSYAYQKAVAARNAVDDGPDRASLLTAQPGRSQHQLGTAIDFGSITDAFAETTAGRWLAANARRFGFSPSYPKGMEALTGYLWESWHYRYVGKDAAALEAEFFGGLQERMLAFLERF